MMATVKFGAFIFLLYYANVAFAYEPGTHLKLSERAVRQSVLGDGSGILVDLGLLDIGEKKQLLPNRQAGKTIALGPNNADLFTARASDTILSLVGTGAALEDEFSRSLFHFHDPVPGHFDSLNINGIPMPYSAPDWALADALLPVAGQSFSLKDAKGEFYKALTSASESDRSAAFGSLFLTLGHVIHLVQDVAQPQHVRNDMHCDADLCKDAEIALQVFSDKKLPLYNPSRYEAYTYDKADAAAYDVYASVSLPTSRSYFASLDNKGLAQFTSENFVSAGTNFHVASNGDVLSNQNYAFPLPKNVSGSESIGDVYAELGKPVPDNIAEYCAAAQDNCGVQFVTTDVIDSYLATAETNTRASSYSIFNQDLERLGSQKLFALNSLNFQKDWAYLLPRAIGYSAGLINYFFRGRLDVKPDPNNPGGYLVINKSSYPMSNGALALYYDDTDGNRHPVPGAGWSNVNIAEAGSDSGDEYPIQFSAPTDPAPATPGQYMLVYQGKIGSEEGVAGKLIKAGDQYVYLAASMSSWCTWYYNCASVVESFDAAYQIHSSSVHLGTLVLPESLAVYGGVDYTIENPAWYNSSYTCNYLAMRNGVQFAASDCQNESNPSYFGAIGVNTQNLYVFSSQSRNYAGDTVKIYDHAGNFISSINNLPVGGVFKASITDSRMCLNGWTPDFQAYISALTDLHGNSLVEFPTDPAYDAYCALTNDRVYLLSFPDGNPALNVYDLSGDQIATLDISEPTPPKTTYLTYWDVAASDQKIYIPIIYEVMDPGGPITFIYKFIVYDHSLTRGPGGIISEKFQREPDVTLLGLHNFFGASVAVDMKDVLGSHPQ